MDPYELTNLAIDPTRETQRLINRLNGLLLTTKSCGGESCRDAWHVLRAASDGTFTSLEEAMDPEYDGYFASLPPVGFRACLNLQEVSNEGPFYPPESASLGSEYRENTDAFIIKDTQGLVFLTGRDARQGSTAQKTATLADMLKNAREVTDAEMGQEVSCGPPYNCGGGPLGGS